MTQKKVKKIGYTCAYTPLSLIDAAGFIPYRVLPMGDSPDQAGHHLHDNICPHVKRILDRAIDKDLPELSGMVFINSCDAMRRLSDAWRKVRPADKAILVDLPTTNNEISASFFAQQLSILSDTLSRWSGHSISDSDIKASIVCYNEISNLLEILKKRVLEGTHEGGSVQLQSVYNRAMTEPVQQTIEFLRKLVNKPETKENINDKVPIYLFGNVLPDPEAFSLFESCDARIVSDDLCTGSRMFYPINVDEKENIHKSLARSLLSRPPCARTFDPKHPVKLAEDVLQSAINCRAHGVIGHTVKFCDPYLARLPTVREVLQKIGLPFLLLEGDCTLRSIGQHRTRIEAFVEMLKDK